jgi:hypothetical protein
MAPQKSFHVQKPAASGRILDRMFLGGCVAAYVVLVGSVVTALRMYGG